MKYRRLGDKEVSALGFGCMRLPVVDGDMSKINESEATGMLHYAIEQGVNYVDTAWPYHQGASEPFVGRALQNGWREKVYLATKLPVWLVENLDDCDRYLDQQLEKLQTDHIDFYLLHALDNGRWPKLLEIDIFRFVEKAIEDGRIGCIGFSFHDDLDQFKPIIDAYDWTFCQIQYNYMDTEFQAGTEGLLYAKSKGIDVIAMEPLRGGKLTKQVPESIQELLDESGIDHTPAELALRWVWNHPEISCVLSGMSTMEHVVENCRIASKAEPNSMQAIELDIIGKIRELYRERTSVPCTDCRYCLPCPEGVNIPQIFTIYNDLHIYGDEKWAKGFYRMFVKAENKADMCVECGQCEEQCPQEIKVISELKKAHEALS